MKLAAADLGSNSLKLTAVELGPEGTRVLFEDAIVTRIGEGLDRTGILSEAAMKRTLAALVPRIEAIRAQGVEFIRCVATAGMRGASNADDFMTRVFDATGVQIELIDGLREAELAFKAPAAAFGPGPVLVMDPGGRSTELVFGTTEQIEARVSLEIGGVRLTERFHPSDPPRDDELQAASAFIQSELKRHAPPADRPYTMVGVSGTIMALLGLELGVDEMKSLIDGHEGQVLHTRSVEESYENLRRLKKAERIRGTIIPEGRADVIVAGAQIVLETLRFYGQTGLRATHRGVRYGLLEEMKSALAL